MPKQRLQEPRFDFSGGLNTRSSPDALRVNELVLAQNARISHRIGAVAKRTGTRRMHQTAVGSGNPVTGLIQWDAPGGKQIVAVSNGRLYHKTTDFGAFSEVIPGTALSTSSPQTFYTARASTSGAPLYLYICDGSTFRWTESAITKIGGTNDVPDADLGILYHLRAFWRDPNFGQTLIYGVLGNPEDGEQGSGIKGGADMIDVLRGEAITALEVVGSSLLIATPDSVSRFTGYSDEDIQIAQDTEGVDPNVGAAGPLCLKRTENFAAMFSGQSVYAVNEQQALDVGEKIRPDFSALSRDSLDSAVVGYHRGRKEVWLAVEGPGDTGNQTVYVMSIGASQGWAGPWTYPFAIHCLASFEDSNGDEYIMAGCGDGFVRLMDTGAKDDVLYDGSGGSTYTMTVEPAPLFFDSGPGYVKTLERIFLQADIQSGKTISVKHAMDDGAFVSRTVTGVGSATENYRVDAYDQGRRLRLQIIDSSDDISIINGLIAQAFDMRRT